MTDQPVVFETRPASGGKQLGIARLNAEKSLNSLTLTMIDLLHAQLQHWAQDDAIAAVWLEGAGEKAFCAGGDVVALHAGSAAYGEPLPDDSCERFFEREYRLDYSLHNYPKPLIVWGSGIVMGGGMGLLCGAPVRIVTETTRMAMPEITIGLFPDVGGSYFLSRAPGKAGLFLGITGAQFNATDACYLGFADWFIPSDKKASLLDFVTQNIGANLSHHLAQFAEPFANQAPGGQVQMHQAYMDQQCAGDDTLAVIKRILSYEGNDAWLIRASKTLASGCPVTPFLVTEQLRRAQGASLADVFRTELIMGVNAARYGHFKEGVRALLIDKDRNPQWTPARFEDVTPNHWQCFFEPPFSGDHPLSDLGA